MTDTGKLRDCSVSCAKTMETRQIKAHEAPIVLGYLASGLAKHTGLPLPMILGMVNKAAHAAHSSENETCAATGSERKDHE